MSYHIELSVVAKEDLESEDFPFGDITTVHSLLQTLVPMIEHWTNQDFFEISLKAFSDTKEESDKILQYACERANGTEISHHFFEPLK